MAFGLEHRLPGLDQASIGPADGADIAVEVVEPPRGFTSPRCSRGAGFQSTWSVSEYQVKPSTGTPSWRSRMTPALCVHNQRSASSPRGPLLVGDVPVVAHHAVAAQLLAALERMIVLPRHTVVGQHSDDAEAADLGETRIGEGPVVDARRTQRGVDLRAIAQQAADDPLHPGKVQLPMVVMTACDHLVAADAAALDGGALFSMPVAKRKS